MSGLQEHTERAERKRERFQRRGFVPRIYLTTGLHEDGEWKRMWYVRAWGPDQSLHFWTWREAINYALSLHTPEVLIPSS